jgi:hypothetical protein
MRVVHLLRREYRIAPVGVARLSLEIRTRGENVTQRRNSLAYQAIDAFGPQVHIRAFSTELGLNSSVEECGDDRVGLNGGSHMAVIGLNCTVGPSQRSVRYDERKLHAVAATQTYTIKTPWDFPLGTPLLLVLFLFRVWHFGRDIVRTEESCQDAALKNLCWHTRIPGVEGRIVFCSVQ